MLYGGKIIIDKLLEVLKPDSLGRLAFLWAVDLLLNTVYI